MDRRTQTAQATPQGDSAAQPGPGADARPAPPPPGGATLIAGRALVQTVRHFFPQLGVWLDRLPDRRVQEACTYSRRFLAGLSCFQQRHCPHCLVQKHGQQTLYLHQVLEAKLLGPGGVVLSLDSEFIENADAAEAKGRSAEAVKQDCELKAMHRLLPRIQKTFPQLRFVLGVDSLYACGPVFALAQKLDWSLVVTFKEGRTPTRRREFRALLPHCPENCLKREWADRPAQEFRSRHALVLRGQ